MKRVLVLAFALISVLSCAAQDAAKQSAKPPMSPTARLKEAKTAFVKNVDGSDIGYDTVTSTIDGWGRYKLVDSPENADLLIEVTSPDEGGGGVSVSSSNGISRTGSYEQSTNSSRELSSGGGTIRLVVRDAKTKLTLWGASEPVKGAMKKNARENNLVEAAQKLVSKFRDRVEPVK